MNQQQAKDEVSSYLQKGPASMKGGKGPKRGCSSANSSSAERHHALTFRRTKMQDAGASGARPLEAQPEDERHGHYRQQGSVHHDSSSSNAASKAKGSFTLSPSHQRQTHLYPAPPPPGPPPAPHGYHGANHAAIYTQPAQHYPFHLQPPYLHPAHPHQHPQMYSAPPPRQPPHTHPGNHGHGYAESSLLEEHGDDEEDEVAEIGDKAPVQRKCGGPRKNLLPSEQPQKRRKRGSGSFSADNILNTSATLRNVETTQLARRANTTNDLNDSPPQRGNSAAELAAALAKENHKLHVELQRKTMENERYKAQAQSLTASMKGRPPHAVETGAAGAPDAKNGQEDTEWEDCESNSFLRQLKRQADLKDDLGRTPGSAAPATAGFRQQKAAAAPGGRSLLENDRYGNVDSGLEESATEMRTPTPHVTAGLTCLQRQRLIQEEQEKQVLRQIAARRKQEAEATAMLGGAARNGTDDSSFQNLFLKERQFNEELRQELAVLRKEKAKEEARARTGKLAKEESIMIENRRLKGRVRDLEKTLAGLRVALGEQEKKTSAAIRSAASEPNPNLATAAPAPTSSGGSVEEMLAELRRNAASSSREQDTDQVDSAMLGLLKKRLITMERTLEQVVNERDAVLRAHQEQQKNLLLLDDEVERQLVKNKTLASEIDASHRQLQESTMRRTILVRQLEEACATNDTLEKRIQELESTNAMLREQVVRWDETRR